MHSTLLALAIALLGIAGTLSAPVEQPHGSHGRGPESKEEQIKYLRRFGHWHGSQGDRISKDEDLRTSLMAFQSFFGLKATGEYDDATKKLMGTPRCGVPDYNEAPGRRKRYVFTGRKWPSTALIYAIQNYTPDLPTNEIKSDIKRAFKFWSDVSPLTFTEAKTEAANINLAFLSGVHGDGDPFDGPNNTLAHGFYPPSGMVHFDEDEDWTHGKTSGANLLHVATHEIGHALGLNHSAVRSSVMWPNEGPINLNFTLDADDIEEIQSIYGKPQSAILPPNENALPASTV